MYRKNRKGDGALGKWGWLHCTVGWAMGGTCRKIRSVMGCMGNERI
jgi:hypothetical protein